ncbi:hypothetical protein VOLCADRAFT_109744 [Volvox carteri f. nagariensis]|uniref:Uncharacterized protein n=1 Tax=Volvox carteri f. nagariensis TaxID=3068 RepID=D8TU75_VOLCA|nr:uncharacterized protein VOLCADRAFT_109744 [Volvox carteri f. nagariensis]EFJ48987.1 hypothetical protein VOLCADRAFT_109744 [Volvox carteri f. nagariensis]|eukprot:XP_002949884.1 hypothetical protein VOLCADRAFT_109744 [Volvox carteri f. nagariensis]
MNMIQLGSPVRAGAILDRPRAACRASLAGAGRSARSRINACATNPKTRSRQKDNPLTVGAVTVMTETLRLFGVGRERYEAVAAEPPRNRPLRRGDVAGLMRRITTDFKQAYLVTGILDDSIYDPDCFFADPTVAFRGVDLWKRNLALLVPFLDQPAVQLKRVQRLGRDEQGAEVVRAEWRLRTFLRLPWRPLIDIDGATEYTLNEESNRIVRHVESWGVSGTQALLQMFRPSNNKSS